AGEHRRELAGEQEESAQVDAGQHAPSHALKPCADRLDTTDLGEDSSRCRPDREHPPVLFAEANDQGARVVRFSPPPTDGAGRIRNFVFEDRHRPSDHSWSATTDMTSSRVVFPSMTRRRPDSRSVIMPLSIAHFRIWSWSTRSMIIRRT